VYRHVIDTPLNGGLSTTWLSRCWGSLIDAVEHHRHEVHRCRAACPWGLSADVNDMGLLQRGGVDRAPVWGSSTSLSLCPRLLWRTWEWHRNASCAQGRQEHRRNVIETHPQLTIAREGGRGGGNGAVRPCVGSTKSALGVADLAWGLSTSCWEFP